MQWLGPNRDQEEHFCPSQIRPGSPPTRGDARGGGERNDVGSDEPFSDGTLNSKGELLPAPAGQTPSLSPLPPA